MYVLRVDLFLFMRKFSSLTTLIPKHQRKDLWIGSCVHVSIIIFQDVLDFTFRYMYPPDSQKATCVGKKQRGCYI